MSQDTPEPDWVREARALGGIDENNNLRLNGLVVIDSIDIASQTVALRLVTPLKAGLHDEELRPKSAPILFDRDETGMRVIPGRWFLEMLEAIREDPGRSTEERDLAATVLLNGIVEDGRVSAERIRCERVSLPETGEWIEWEILLPPMKFVLRFVDPSDGATE